MPRPTLPEDYLREDSIDDFNGLHASGQQEHSLCGMAPEAFETGDSEAPIVFAARGEVVTCKTCRSLIDYVRANFKRYRYSPVAD